MMRIGLFDTKNHYTPILKEWQQGFLDLGHKASFNPIEDVNMSYCLYQNYDLIVFVGTFANPQILEDIKKRNPKTLVVCTSDSYHSKFEEYKSTVDFFITTQHKHPSLFKGFNDNGLNLHSIPLAGNDHLFYPVSTKENYDICFIGGLHHGYRGEDVYLYPFLDDPKYKCFLGGMKYKEFGIPSVPYYEANQYRNETKVNINFHVDYQKPGSKNLIDRIDLNQSVYNIALTGKLQICDHPLVEELFENNIPVFSKEEWKDGIDYYLKHSKVRTELGTKARKIALSQHTWKVRMQEFLEIVNKCKK